MDGKSLGDAMAKGVLILCAVCVAIGAAAFWIISWIASHLSIGWSP